MGKLCSTRGHKCIKTQARLPNCSWIISTPSVSAHIHTNVPPFMSLSLITKLGMMTFTRGHSRQPKFKEGHSQSLTPFSMCSPTLPQLSHPLSPPCPRLKLKQKHTIQLESRLIIRGPIPISSGDPLFNSGQTQDRKQKSGNKSRSKKKDRLRNQH